MAPSTSTGSPRPKYQQIASDLKERIRGGEYAHGDPLPSLVELGERYAVSQITVRQAVRLLVEQGVVKTVPRRGIFAESGAGTETGPVEHRVGVLLPSLRHWSELYVALCEELHALRYDILMKPLPVRTDFTTQPARALFELEALRATCGSGLIMYGDRSLVETFLRERGRDEVGVCLENHNGIPAAIPLVTTDNFGGTLALTRHLIALGHTRIAYLDLFLLKGPTSERLLPGTTHEQRFAGYAAALDSAGLAPSMPPDFLSALVDPPEPETLARLFRRPGMPTALICFNDSRAGDVYRRLTAAGIPVPAEISLAGYDNQSTLLGGSWLTSLDQNAPEIARQLARLLHGERQRPRSRGDGHTPQILVPPILHLRDSIAPAPR